MRIKSVILKRFRNAAHFQLHTEFKHLVELFTPEALKIVPLFAAYLLLYERLDAAYKNIIKSIYTEQIHDADKARDIVFRGMCDTINTAIKHFDPGMREAARHLKIVIDTYGNVAKNTQNEETAAVINIVQELEGPYAKYVRDMNLMPYVVELKARNIAFANLVRNRAYESSLKDFAAHKKAREKLDKKFYEIVECLNAFAVLEALGVVEWTGIYDRLIAEFNVHVDKFNLLLPKGGKRGKNEAGDSQIEEGV